VGGRPERLAVNVPFERLDRRYFELFQIVLVEDIVVSREGSRDRSPRIYRESLDPHLPQCKHVEPSL
jgi:hypothetical protein